MSYELIIFCVVAGSSCVARHPVHNLWYRGIIKGYADDSLQTVLIELVDLGVSQVVNRVDVKQLACQYSNVRFNTSLTNMMYLIVLSSLSNSVAASLFDGTAVRSR